MKIFGIGLSRTGTTSLAKALEILGNRAIHYPHDTRTYTELARGQYRLTVLDRYDAITDIVAAPFYMHFDKTYPGSKFVLTTREKESWLESIRAHFERLGPHWDQNPGERPFADFIHAAVHGTLAFDRDRMSWVYDFHLQNVLSYLSDRPDDLLVIDLCSGDPGWSRLCSFLGAPEPDVPFPHINRRKGKKDAT